MDQLLLFSLFAGHGNGSFSLKVTLDGGGIDFPIFIDATDVNNDGHQDILATEQASGVMTLLLNRNQCNSTLI